MDKPWLNAYEPGVPTTIAYPEQPLYAFLDRAADLFPDHVAIHFYGARMRYRFLGDAVNRFANALIALGVQKGDRVALHLPNTPQFVIAYYGALKAGAVVVTHSPLYTEPELAQQLNDCGAETIVTLTMTYARVQAVRSKTPLRNVIVANIKDYFPPHLNLLFTLAKEKKEGHRAQIAPGDHSFVGLLRAAPSRAPGVDVRPDDLALLQYTGGTTGTPKAAMLTHRIMVTNVLQGVAWNTIAHPGQETFLCVLPFFHIYGQQVGMNQAVHLASAMILFPRFERGPTLAAIDHYHPSVFPGVATLYINLLQDPELAKHDLRSIKVCVSGAMALPAEVQERFERVTGGRLVEGYGMTETAPLTHCNPIHGRRTTGSIGLPVPDTEAAIISLDDGDTLLPTGEIGEICVRGPQIMRGYWNRPDETQRMIRNGWLHTGDIGRMDEAGFFYVVDRIKDMIIAGGFKIFPRDVEEVLYRHPKIKEAALVAVKDPYHGELPKAHIVLKDGETATPEEIIAYCREHLSPYKVPKQVEFHSDLPKTLVGKILKRKLSEADKASAVAAPTEEIATP
ncbi:MAG: long-chain fatty acid--CoA ligase [Chloroflexi bacterium]|nr:long-chain fatty acid--CoA ligase [Chloroflexota bacterium]